ncbi:thymidylate synthetase [Acinetobacter phage MD-2021a]|nr:thymidylate synthetase [Acinetobacter phage MD-2021a]
MARINEEEISYLMLLSKLLKAAPKDDRTGTGTSEIFGHQMRFDLSKGFPLLTTKKVHFKSIAIELFWFLRGRTDNQWLQERGVTIWDEWATEEQCAKFGRKEGDLGPIYGHQWRNFTTVEEITDSESDQEYNLTGFDQIAWVINEIKTNPNSRRLIVSGWNPSEANQVALPPCHTMFQFHVNEGKLSCQLYQRSADTFLGVPFNIASYALLTHIIAKECNLEVGEFIWTGGCVHLYKNHFEQAKLQLTRSPRQFPKLIIKNKKPFDEYEFEDFEIVDYNPHPSIKAEVAV